LTVLTYNVHGLPWPIASGRPAALAAIGERLKALHQVGAAPGIALIQEAFTADAQAIARRSGYRHAAFGPDQQGAASTPLPPGVSGPGLTRGERWIKGEGIGKWTGSGLLILSDYPIIRTARMSYSAAACAGFDCLAAKGAMLAELALPDGRHVEVVDTHLNSRHASGVIDDRSNRAWLVQIAELRAFVARNHDHRLPLLVGGDFNVGGDIVRRLGFADFADTIGGAPADALRDLVRRGARLSQDGRYELARARDWQLSAAGSAARLAPLAASVPFGPQQRSAFSDHFGYQIRYALS
jgi:endonuclease/exonuclease/phosphatase family metal-dependent hydrolase